jgi:hypothetical protein
MSLSGLIRILITPRIAGLVLALAGLLVFSGCWVASINPLYEGGSFDNQGKDPDLFFDRNLTGSWSAIDDKCTILLMITAKDRVYDLQTKEQGDGCSDENLHRQARLVKLDAHYFLDVSPMDDDVCDMCLAKHDIFLARFDRATLSLAPIDSDWLTQSLAAKTVSLATLAGDTDTITASSKELKAFCRKYAEDETVFESIVVFRRPISTSAN